MGWPGRVGEDQRQTLPGFPHRAPSPSNLNTSFHPHSPEAVMGPERSLMPLAFSLKKFTKCIAFYSKTSPRFFL